MKYKRTERVGLFIETQEGDTVRLRFGTRETLKVDETQGGENDATSNDVTLVSQSKTKMSISIRGDLNADELAAIQQTFEQATALSDEFFAGNVLAAFEGASALNFDAEQLARVHFKASFKAHLTYSPSGFGSGPAAPLGPGPSPETDAPVKGEVVDSDAPVDGAAPAVAEFGESDPAIEGEGAVEEAPSADLEETGEVPVSDEPTTLDPKQIIGDFLSRLAESLGGDSGSDSTGLLDFSLKVRVFRSTLMTLAEMRGPEESVVPELVPEVLDAVADQQQAPLDEVA